MRIKTLKRLIAEDGKIVAEKGVGTFIEKIK